MEFVQDKYQDDFRQAYVKQFIGHINNIKKDNTDYDSRGKKERIDKKQFENVLKLEASMAREMSRFIRENLAYFQEFDNVILYYDNGQHELNRILNTLFATELSEYDVRRVLPKDYKLFQAADLMCTLKLLELKCDHGTLTKSEELVFHSKRELRKDFIKPLQKKEFGA